MSHRITYKPTGILLTSQIGEVGIAVDGNAVDVTLTAVTGQREILSERYYAYGGRVTLYDIASLIEAEMRGSGVAYASFKLSVGNGSTVHDSVTFNVLHCDRYTLCTAPEVFLAENFLTTLQHRRVAPGDTLSLFYFAKQGEDITAHIDVRWRRADSPEILRQHYGTLNGTNVKTQSTGVVQLNISQPSLATAISNAHGVKTYAIEIVGYTVRVGQRAVTAYVDGTLAANDSFLFRNCFNVWDSATLPCVTKSKTDVDRSTAVVNGISSFYDQKVEQTFEVECGPLTSDECAWLDQLAASREVMRIVANPCDDSEPWLFAPVLVTDSSVEVSDTDEKPNIVKFTWRYADHRPHVLLSASPGIFKSPFNLPFS